MKLYNVFEIDRCFESYAADVIIVGGESVKDILDHFDEIFPPYVEEIHREDWMDDEAWDDFTECGKYKEGDIRVIPQFDENQMKEFKKSLKRSEHWPRIKEIHNMFTDIPYKYLTGFGYCE